MLNILLQEINKKLYVKLQCNKKLYFSSNNYIKESKEYSKSLICQWSIQYSGMSGPSQGTFIFYTLNICINMFDAYKINLPYYSLHKNKRHKMYWADIDICINKQFSLS